ncbi:PASTA domain-containing protein [Nannocystis punicea]|uniref:PASTA domain-containing protein n=1 Tax=Nannocystis punicea TaxID=2995304 RepID=A0ABY7HBL6_9BACT|nr:PASTA domain-containing protein [Nannocystis poenicansa]WAS96652.1 PASTA domain-containing protein [Nannocystis poenicansa]
MSARAVEEAGEDDLDGLAVFAVDDFESESVAPVAAVEPIVMATVTEVDLAALPVEPLGPALVVVPDIEQMTLRKAAKELAAVGLKLSVRDEYGDAVPRWSWGDYEVRTQKVDAGTEVVPGATVKAKARALRRLVSGY